jgi:hypothetical protein
MGRLEERPFVVRAGQELVELSEGAPHLIAHRHSTAREPATQVLDVGVEIGTHPAPARRHRARVGRAPDRLEGREVEQAHLRTFQRIHEPGEEIALEAGKVALDHLDERLLRGPVRRGEGGSRELAGGGELGAEAGFVAGAGAGREILELGVESPVADRSSHGGGARERPLPVLGGQSCQTC